VNKIELKKGIYWVGAIDWDIRNFHGYSTRRGTTYNAYLIVDEKIVLVDTVKHHLYEQMIARIKEIVDPSQIDLIVFNHVEMDHSGCLPEILKEAPNARAVASVMGVKGLKSHYGDNLDIDPVKSGETLNIGGKNLTFVHVPMVHWPDSMVTYIAEDKLLLPNDAFGQHIASAERFDDQLEWGILLEEAAKYYANIVMPYGDKVCKALDATAGLDIDMIAPSHGIIWRSRIPNILEAYKKWANFETEKKALIVYDSMWGSTAKMAFSLAEGLEESGVPATMRNLSTNHISDIVTDVLTTKLILLGSPTLNNGMLPTMGSFLTYLKGLRPKGRVGLAFGSYGWGGQAAGEIKKAMEEMNWDLPEESLRAQYIPTDDELENARILGGKLGEYVIGE